MMSWRDKHSFIGPSITEHCLIYRRNEQKILLKELRLKLENAGKIRKWSIVVKNRDSNKCVCCGEVDNLHAHHIKSKSEYPELMYSVDNGLTLCAECHAKEHEGSGGGTLLKSMPRRMNTIKVGGAV